MGGRGRMYVGTPTPGSRRLVGCMYNEMWGRGGSGFYFSKTGDNGIVGRKVYRTRLMLDWTRVSSLRLFSKKDKIAQKKERQSVIPRHGSAARSSSEMET